VPTWFGPGLLASLDCMDYADLNRFTWTDTRLKKRRASSARLFLTTIFCLAAIHMAAQHFAAAWGLRSRLVFRGDEDVKHFRRR
jgi:hypothetical protein